VHDVFLSIFGLAERPVRYIPPPIKFLFDFLDEQAKTLEIDDPEIRHTWKNNSLPLRFWINMIKNPNFVFDISKPTTVDSCLSVIAQLFMDSCSYDDHQLGKDSPSNKLLYAKEIPEYKKIVKRFYEDVASAPSNDTDFEHLLEKISNRHNKCFNSLNAARELLRYAVKHKVRLMDNLEEYDLESLSDDLQGIMERLPDD